MPCDHSQAFMEKVIKIIRLYEILFVLVVGGVQ